ncbi:MAG TPA: transcriptional repressor LexA [Candidatus Paceibacterota bacterium]|nr:transcriptional repressor LexA [Candidatus Pacearchaeota archaeon]HRZ50448.1 transcriptional repressor LexA [Candidatus Paceibacterota bacterium]HSA36169.1 transcriptional repressor LexA [Candidatus Paceibacterota bacterium]
MPKNAAILIRRFYETNKRMPVYSEIMKLLRFKSKNSVFKLVKKLETTGFLEKDKTGKLIPASLYRQTRILGYVQAGFPTPAEEELVDTISLDEYLISNRDATFILKIGGDSMADAGILEGDMVIVDRSITPKNGDIVIAEVDSEWTIKYLVKTKTRVYLKPGNKKYPPIYPKNELKIAAVVKAVIRKY